MDIKVTVPDGVSGDWAVETFTVSERDAKFENMRAMFGSGRSINPGTYKKLTRNNNTIMSNTPAEISDHLSFIRMAMRCENILINGLGLGVALKAILESDIPERIDVIEKSEDVINLVADSFTYDDRVNIIHSCAYDFKPDKGIRYGVVWHDIFDDICADNLPYMIRLKRKYEECCDWQGCWAEEICIANR